MSDTSNSLLFVSLDDQSVYCISLPINKAKNHAVLFCRSHLDFGWETLALDPDILVDITPQNVREKLSTILLFT